MPDFTKTKAYINNKPSRSYWINRAEHTLIDNEKSILEYESTLRKAYEDTILRINKELDAFYGRYAKDQRIDLAEARKRLTPQEAANFKISAQHYLDEVERLGESAFTDQYRSYLKELSGKAYVTKLDEITTNIRHHLETLSTNYEVGLGNALSNMYEDGFYKTVFNIQKKAGFGTDFTAPSDKQLKTAVKERWNGQNYSDRIWNDKTRLVSQLNQTLSQNFVRGKNSREVAKDFAGKLQTSYSNAQRLIRTETNYISNKATMKAYNESGVVNQYEYLATLDARTSDICREMDGKVFLIKQAQAGVNLPPLHPYCRSTTIPYFEDEEDTLRIARDKEGKSYIVDGKTKYKDWVQEHTSAGYAERVKQELAKYTNMDLSVAQVLEEEDNKGSKEPIPRTLENFTDYEKQWYSNRIINNEEGVSQSQIEEADQALKNIVNNGDLCMRIPSDKVLSSILDDGYFKSQFETNTSRGTLNKERRKLATNQLFGVKNNLNEYEYEKYGYLGSKDMITDMSGDNNADQYGNIAIRFKHSLINRTTMTYGDSLGPALAGRIIATPISNPRSSGIKYTSLDTRTKEVINSAKKGSNDPIKTIEYGYESYFELQYHGDLTTDDIESVCFDSKYGDLSLSTIKRLRDKGIRVYEYEHDKGKVKEL